MSSEQDRELLELAAKASGMFVLTNPWPDVDGWFFCMQHDEPAMHFRKYGKPSHQAVSWRPLTDDGDALRLAVKLGMQIDTRDPETHVYVAGAGERVDEYHTSNDPCAATRRAITRAAAALAKGEGKV